jgi:HSP20 family protein
VIEEMLTRYRAMPSSSALELFDRMFPRFSSAFEGAGDGSSLGSYGAPVNLSSDEANYYIDVLVPGLAAEDLEVTWQDGALIMSGKVEFPVAEGRTSVWSEIRPYQFRRVVKLGDIDAEKVEAKLEHGVLHVTAPKSDHAKPRTIKIVEQK